ncbi:hypothetical protein LY90DRAFT_506492 [Neocallimastix californiae]|uniref:Auto-transporter adhesin head GIN domain-containing protein n=1 Tax=Neocallimastix californiae TaxID=1754190 RepID=A0A1Y2DDL8_9FUNG|nr:hypothetical protein LY90DRAFT_506492 [Neocallimastix californiae]|eukprot:ORY57339.1 hypothetical protein LY90DRAFT_506492 [Neocallimastix californiae]
MKLIIKLIFLIIIIIWCKCKSEEINVINEDELIKTLSSHTSEELIINIKNIELKIQNNIKINEKIKNLSIIGTSKETSIITFSGEANGFIFQNTLQEISLHKITIYGDLNFIHNSNILILDVILNGAMNINENSINNESIQMDNFTYNSSKNLRTNCIQLHGNVEISNSSFYGSSFCKDSVLYYDGENLNSIKISNSYFNGMYQNNCLNLMNSASSNIIFSKFEKGKANINGG